MTRSRQLRGLKVFLPGLLFLILAGIFENGCRPKYVRQPVPAADVLKANAIAQEGDIAFARGDHYRALIKYLEAMHLNPYDELLLNRLGIAYSKLNFYDEAREAFQKAVDLDPKLAFAFNNIGSVYFAEQNFGKAEKYFKKAIRLKKDDPSFHMNLASIYLEKKKPKKAIAEWRKALAIDPNAFSKTSSVSLGANTKSSQMEKSYFIARLYGSMGNVEMTIENLKEAFNYGFSDIKAIKTQEDFNPVRKDARFVEFIENLSLLIKLRSKAGPPVQTSQMNPTPLKAGSR